MPITKIVSADDKKVKGLWEIDYLKKQVAFTVFKGKRKMRFVFDQFDWEWTVKVAGRMKEA